MSMRQGMEIIKLARRINELEERLAKLEERQRPETYIPKRKPGRPRKEETQANG